MSFFISRLYIRGLSSVKKDDIPLFSNRKLTQSTTEPKKIKFSLHGLVWQVQDWLNLFKNRQDGKGKRLFLHQKSRLNEDQAAA